MRKNGKITYWNYQKGYGFIEPDSGDERVFVKETRGKKPDTHQISINEVDTTE